jgi:hypothetical protein
MSTRRHFHPNHYFVSLPAILGEHKNPGALGGHLFLRVLSEVGIPGAKGIFQILIENGCSYLQ